MNLPQDEAKKLRIQDAALVDGFSQSGRDPSVGMPSLVARTTTIATYPTGSQTFFACSPLTILGSEVEGAQGTISSGVSTFFALNLGSSVPPVGSNILVTFVDNRWVFRYDG